MESEEIAETDPHMKEADDIGSSSPDHCQPGTD